MFNMMSGGHLLLLLIIVLLLFGAKRLPDLGSSLGKGLRAFKKGLEGLDEDKPSQRLEDDRKFSSPRVADHTDMKEKSSTKRSDDEA